MMKEFFLYLLCFATIFGATADASDHQAVFSDGNFFSEDWTTLVLLRDDTSVAGAPPLTSLGSVTRQTSGGVSNTAYMRSIHHINLGDAINTTGIYIDESYDPRQGAISTVDFSYMVNHFSTTGTVTGVRPALLQNGRLFVGSSLQTFSGNQWVQRSASGLDPNDFFLQAISGSPAR